MSTQRPPRSPGCVITMTGFMCVFFLMYPVLALFPDSDMRIKEEKFDRMMQCVALVSYLNFKVAPSKAGYDDQTEPGKLRLLEEIKTEFRKLMTSKDCLEGVEIHPVSYSDRIGRMSGVDFYVWDPHTNFGVLANGQNYRGWLPKRVKDLQAGWGGYTLNILLWNGRD